MIINEMILKLKMSSISPIFMVLGKKNVIYWDENVNKNKETIIHFPEYYKKRIFTVYICSNME